MSSSNTTTKVTVANESRRSVPVDHYNIKELKTAMTEGIARVIYIETILSISLIWLFSTLTLI
jgi:hypothetical protein